LFPLWLRKMLKRDNHCLTSLKGKKKSKAEKVFGLLGDLDELGVTLGLVRAVSRKKRLRQELESIQEDLIAIGGFLVSFKKGPGLKKKTASLEARILKLENNSVKEFSRPGVNQASAYLHLARVVCRRVEREMVRLKGKEEPLLVAYFNRLSLLLFWLAVKEEKRK